MGVKYRERGGAWWIFVNHRGRRKAKRIGPGEAGKKAAKEAARAEKAAAEGGDASPARAAKAGAAAADEEADA